MDISLFDYHLPQELIAQEPLKERDRCRLLVLHRDSSKIEHKYFRDIIEYISPFDTIVLNKTKVIKARLFGKKQTGGKVEILLLNKIDENIYSALLKPHSRIKESTKIFLDDELYLEVIEKKPKDFPKIKFNSNPQDLLDKYGKLPLPPYIKKELKQEDLYQTVFAENFGSVAAPTAGLHFTDELIQSLIEKKVNVTYITLHINIDTFRPIKEEDVLKHKIHSEYFEIDNNTAEIINNTISENRKIIAVGTTVVRTLESSAKKTSSDRYIVEPKSGWTNLYIYPGYEFKIVSSLITNFHSPKSSLLLLVSAYTGREKILNAYKEAISHKYRFLSFGDAMFII